MTWDVSMDGTLPVIHFGSDEYWTTDDLRSGIPSGIGGALVFQHGPVKEAGSNGTQIETVIRALVARLEGFNAGPFRCRENSLAITHMEEALHWLEARTRARQNRGVEGTNVA